MNINRILSVMIAAAVAISCAAVMTSRLAANVTGRVTLAAAVLQNGLPASGCWVQI